MQARENDLRNCIVMGYKAHSTVQVDLFYVTWMKCLSDNSQIIK